MRKFQHWSKDDLALVRIWVNENPDVIVHWLKGNQELNRLFPDRPCQGIYHQWRKMHRPLPNYSHPRKRAEGFNPKSLANLKGNKSVAASFTDPELSAVVTPSSSMTAHLIHVLLETFSFTVEKYVTERVEIKTSLIVKENADMKALLQKLTKIREAITDFKL